MSTDSDYKSIPDFAEQLKVHPNTVRRMIARGEVDAIRVGAKIIRIDANSYDPRSLQTRPDARPMQTRAIGA